MNKTHLLLFTLLSFFLISCASDAEKEERRQNAFDLQGVYASKVTANSELAMTMSIQNENGKRHDILINLERTNDIENSEKTFLVKNSMQNLETNLKQSFGKNMIFGAGYNPHFDGGENISDDFGETSKFYVCTSSKKLAENISASYCLSGTITKQSMTTNGALSLNIVKTTKQVVNGKEESNSETFIHSMKYNADTDNVFFKQYFGTWQGRVNTNTAPASNVLNLIQSLQIKALNENEIQVIPTATSLVVDGKKFVYSEVESIFSTAQLIDYNVPLLSITWKANTGESIIAVIEIYSLGNMAGAVGLLSNGNFEGWGTINFRKF
jgi:hypothetical protein